MQENHPSPEAHPGNLARRVFTGRTPMQRTMLVNSIARDLGRSVEEVAPVYDQIYEQMARTAIVMDFLPALVLKNLRHHFHQLQDESRH